MSSSALDLKKFYQSKKGLVIDDFPDMRGSVRRMLLSFGMEHVDTAYSGADAMEKCRETDYDIILADYNLGEGKNGQQILEELRYNNSLKHTNLYVMITAESTKSMVFGALEYQPDDYLTKPFTPTVLQKRLNRLMVEKMSLQAINQCIDNREFQKAIALCLQKINSGDKLSRRCYRIMGDCLYRSHQYQQGRELYEKVLEERFFEWASIGLGKCLIELNELDRAETLFNELIQNGSLCVEVYDWLAKVKALQGDAEEAQLLLERAIEISPNAILRQEKLAKLSEENQDWQRAELSHKKVIRLGNNSVYESPELHFNLARCISSELRNSVEKDKNRIKDAEDVLRIAKRKYGSNNEIKLQTEIIAANVYADADEIEESKSRMEALSDRINLLDSTNVRLNLDLAQAYKSTGEHEKAKEILTRLAATHADDEAIGDAIDSLSDEPLSTRGKQKAIELNQRGKKMFADKDYGKAISLFDRALNSYPNNVALNLNLMLALVQQMSQEGAEKALVERCEKAREKLGHIASDHALFERYQLLCTHLEKLKLSL